MKQVSLCGFNSVGEVVDGWNGKSYLAYEIALVSR